MSHVRVNVRCDKKSKTRTIETTIIWLSQAHDTGNIVHDQFRFMDAAMNPITETISDSSMDMI